MRSLVLSILTFVSTASQAMPSPLSWSLLDFRFGDDIEIPGEFEKAGTFRVTAPDGVDTTQFEVSVVQCPLDTHGGPTFGGCAKSRKIVQINEESRVIPGFYVIAVFDLKGQPIAYKALTVADKDQITLPLVPLKIKKGTSEPVDVSVYPDYGDSSNWLAYLRLWWGVLNDSISRQTNTYSNICGNLSNTPRFPILKPICEKLMTGITRPEDLDGFFVRRDGSGQLESLESNYQSDYTVVDARWTSIQDGLINQLRDGETVLVFPGVYSLRFTAVNGQTIIKNGVRVNAVL